MAHFDVYRNPNPATRARIPYLLDVPSDLLDPLVTRVVGPYSTAQRCLGDTAFAIMIVLAAAESL